MAIVIDKATIGSNRVDSGSTTIAFNTNQTVASGGFIVVGGGWFANNALTVSSVAGGSLTWAVDRNMSAANQNGSWMASAQAPSGLASGTTITATISGSPLARTIGGTSFTGVKTTSPVDGTPLLAHVNSASWSSGSYAIAAGSVIVAVNWNFVGGNTATAPSIEAWELFDGPTQTGTVMEYRIESSAGSYTVAGTLASADNNDTATVAYLAAATAVDTGLAWIVA
jgi:hypothetical protein